MPAESCECLAVQCRAKGVCALTLIHPFVGSAQGASESVENKCADIQKVNSCLQQDQFPWELCVSAIFCESRLCVCVAVIPYCVVDYFNKSAFHKKTNSDQHG